MRLAISDAAIVPRQIRHCDIGSRVSPAYAMTASAGETQLPLLPQLFEDPFLFQLVHSGDAEVEDAYRRDAKDQNTFLVVGKFLTFFRFPDRDIPPSGIITGQYLE